jgi:hypothetical protein
MSWSQTEPLIWSQSLEAQGRPRGANVDRSTHGAANVRLPDGHQRTIHSNDTTRIALTLRGDGQGLDRPGPPSG